MAVSLIPYISSFDKVFNPGTTQSYQLAIRLALDGFSFLVRDTENHRIVGIEAYRSNEDFDDSKLLEAVKMATQAKGWGLDDFSSVQFIIENRQNTFVPSELYEEAKAATLLGFNHTLSPESLIRADIVTNAACVNLYAISNTLYDGLKKMVKEMHISHQTSILLHKCITEAVSDAPEVHVHVKDRNFDVAIVKNSQLLFFNNFEFSTKDDFAYFLLLAMKQHDLSAIDTAIYLSGMILASSDIVKLCKRYIKDIRFVQADTEQPVSDALQEIPFHHYYIPYLSFSCVL